MKFSIINIGCFCIVILILIDEMLLFVDLVVVLINFYFLCFE